MRIALVLLFLLCGVGAFAESQPPSPTPLEKSNSPQKISKESHNKPTVISKGTDDSPIVVKLANPQYTDLKATNDTKKDDKKSSPEWWIVGLTIGLVITGILQWLSLRSTVKEMNAATKVSEIAADAAQKSANAAEKALTSIERPYIFIFGASQLEIDVSRTGGLTPSITYQVANYGKTPAIIENVCAGFSVSDFLPVMPIRVDETNDLLISHILSAGESRANLRQDFPENMHQVTFARGPVTPELSQGEDLFFWVIVHYRGALTGLDESSACWRYDKAADCFVKHGHEEYNYPTKTKHS